MKFLLASTVAALLATAPAFAQDTTIFAANETAGQGAQAAPAQDGTSISLDGFTGGVSASDAHDGGGGGMMIQMLMPSTGSAASTTPGPFVARAAVTNSH